METYASTKYCYNIGEGQGIPRMPIGPLERKVLLYP